LPAPSTRGIDLWFSTKDTVSKTYDARFRDIFQQEYDANWKMKFEAAGIEYFFTSSTTRRRGSSAPKGLLWALKNYDGDVMSISSRPQAAASP